MNLSLAYAVFVLLLAWSAMACAGCPGCGGGGCSEPTCPGTCSANCTGGTCKCSYTICPWPSLSGTGCLPGGNCNTFANQKFCLRNTATDVWKSTAITVDCTTTYGVVVDIQWVMTLGGAGAVSLNLYAYLTGTSTLVATIATYAGTINLASCDQPFRVAYVSDGGQCGAWPCIIRIQPNCCVDCLPPPGCYDPCACNIAPQPAPPQTAPPLAVVTGLSATNHLCVYCPDVFDGTAWNLPYADDYPSGPCNWTVVKALGAGASGWCLNGNGQAFVTLLKLGGVYQIIAGIIEPAGVGGGTTVLVVYELPASQFHCDGGNVFPRKGYPFCGGGYPSGQVCSGPTDPGYSNRWCDFPDTVSQSWL